MNETRGFPLEGIPELPEGYWWHVNLWTNREGATVQIRRDGGLIGTTCAHYTLVLLHGTIKDRHIRRASRIAYRRFRKSQRSTAQYVGTVNGIEVQP